MEVYSMEQVSEKSRAQVVQRQNVPLDRDTLVLARNGKKQVLKRRFGLFSMTSLAIAMMQTWSASIVGLGLGLRNGGPAGVLWGSLVTWIGFLSIFVSMGELASMAPTAAGQYHWVALLAPKSLRVPLSYVVGWFTVLAWVAAVSGCYIAATLLQQLISTAIPSYTPQPYQGTLIMWALLLLAVFINTALGCILPAINLTFLIIFCVSFFAVLIPVVSLGERGNVYELFTRFEDGGGWGSYGLAFWVGLQGTVAAYIGTDCAVHMSEEVAKAETYVSTSMIVSIFLNGALAFGILIAVLLYGGPIDALLNSPNQYPFMDALLNATHNVTAVYILTAVIIFMQYITTITAVSSGSRMIWSFARDEGLPFSRFLSRVDRRSALPVVAIFAIFTCAALIGLIQIGSQVAFQAILSLLIEGCCLSYLVVLLLLLYNRVTRRIEPYQPDVEHPLEQSERHLMWGPWHLPHTLGIVNNALGCCFLVTFTFFSLWPPTREVDGSTMNFSSAILGGVMILSAVYYAVWARKTYHGPIVEVKI